MKFTELARVVDKYDALLLDAYGVLVNQGGALAGAAQFLDDLAARGKPYFILTNDASRQPETIARRFRGFGLDVPAERIITSGSLLVDYFARKELIGTNVMVLGTEESAAYVRQASGHVVPLDAHADADVLVVCDDSGFDFLDGVEAAMTMLMRHIDAGKRITLVLCNPDIIYPKGEADYGFTSGAVALLIEAALTTRYGARVDLPRFARLGKPFAPIFEAAIKRTGTRNVMLVGDQVGTDILGARNFGIDSALVATGLTHVHDAAVFDPEPTYLVRGLI